jgi:hypothetical protein
VQFVRVVVLVLLLFGMLVFSWANWDQRVIVQIWSDLIVETNVPALVILSFMAGFLPLLFLHRTSKWRLSRRVRSLEKAIRDAVGTAAGTESKLQPESSDDEAK